MKNAGILCCSTWGAELAEVWSLLWFCLPEGWGRPWGLSSLGALTWVSLSEEGAATRASAKTGVPSYLTSATYPVSGLTE